MVRMLTPLRRYAAMLVCTVAMVMGALPAMAPTKASADCLPSTLSQRLSQIRSKFGAVKIISTFRRGALIAGTRRTSYHASCRAVDFIPPPGKYAQVASWLKANHGGGVGTYGCGMHHIHIDSGPHVRFHKCAGGGGGHRHASRNRSRNRTYAARSSRKSKSVRVARRNSSKSRVASSSSPRASRYRQLAQPKQLRFDVDGHTIVN